MHNIKSRRVPHRNDQHIQRGVHLDIGYRERLVLEARAEIPRPVPHPRGGAPGGSAEAHGEAVAEIAVPEKYPRSHSFHATGAQVGLYVCMYV